MVKRIIAGILMAEMLLAGSALSAIYMYVDDSGQINYTNDLSSVPVDKLGEITEFKEYKNEAIPASPSPGTRKTPSQSNYVNPAPKDPIKNKQEQREKLESEYNALLIEKKALDNNTSFQKRRKKRKYQNRPYIKELIKKETTLIKRLTELKAKLKIIEKQLK